MRLSLCSDFSPSCCPWVTVVGMCVCGQGGGHFEDMSGTASLVVQPGCCLGVLGSLGFLLRCVRDSFICASPKVERSGVPRRVFPGQSIKAPSKLHVRLLEKVWDCYYLPPPLPHTVRAALSPPPIGMVSVPGTVFAATPSHSVRRHTVTELRHRQTCVPPSFVVVVCFCF